MADSAAMRGLHGAGRTYEISHLGDLFAKGDTIKRFLEATARPVLDLLVRLWLAQTFLASGLYKLGNWEAALNLAATEYPLSWLDPVTAAYLGVTIEVAGGVLLVLGLLTRPAAAALLALAVVTQIAFQHFNLHVYWAVLLGWFVAMGAGALSLDRLVGSGAAQLPLPLIRLLTALYRGLTRFVGPLYLLAVRVLVAAVFAIAGLGIAGGIEGGPWLLHFRFHESYLTPGASSLVACWMGVAVPAFLALGLLTRAAAIMGFALILAVVAAGAMMPGQAVDVGYVLVLFALIATRGAGPVSADELGRYWLRDRFPQLDGRPAFALDGLPRVVIVGAGFGGIAAARALRHVPCQVTIIDRRNYHLFQPLLYQVATATLSPADIAEPIRTLFADQHNARVVLGRVETIDKQAREVVTADGGRHRYDYLVLATGARHDYFGKDEWEKFAPGLKKVDDATDIRRRLLIAFEQAENATDPAVQRQLLTFVIVGAGPTGVELAGAVAELARHGMAREFANIDPATARVILVQSGPRVLPAFPEELSAATQRALEGLGVEVRLNGRVKAVDGEGVMIGDERVPSKTVFWAAGVIASSAAKWLGAEADKAGRVVVGENLAVAGHPEIFAIGDTAASSGWNGKPVPGLAPAAKQGGDYVARVVRARIEGRPTPGPFRYRHQGSLATIGRKAAVADFGWLKLSGPLAWWFWGAVHVLFLAGMRSRIAVAVQWFWAYLTFKRSTRLITGGEG